MTAQIEHRAAELTTARTPFVRATVVRAQEPSSARPGDQAIVLPDGSVEGFVGGQCAEGSLRTAALDALQTGESLLLRVLPESEEPFPELPGATVVVNPCLSGGALEIYLEPLLPSPVLYLVGGSPVAQAVADLAPAVGFVVERSADGAAPAGALAAVVASHGGDESGQVRRALDAGVGFVGVVCSHTRGKALLAELDLTVEERRRVHPHVGVEIGARTAPEIALSIVAELVRSVRVEGLSEGTPARVTLPVLSAPQQAVDPVCGMTVTVSPDAIHATVDGVDYWFCNHGCRKRFLKEHAT